ncbi:unnamed protein product [Arctia plantaginis]|uniref:Uncharacterized protein n=1 Tax=Arctia plantaginis TaxID=874455 RepID=A0A8S1BQ21_ARCPL|nr:unnamed protein product [Arctia plantaginis]
MCGHVTCRSLSVFSGFTDVQTLFLACFGTLLPLLAVLFATLLIRCLCRRYCPTFCKKPTGSLESESSDKEDANHQQVSWNFNTPLNTCLTLTLPPVFRL